MEGYAYLGIIVLAGLVLASLQTPLGTLLLLYHSSLSKHVRPKTKRLASSYISGVTLTNFLLVSTIALLIAELASGLSKTILSVVLGVLVALALISWCFYYKRGTTTELWFPRQLAKYLSSHAKSTTNESEAYTLGLAVPFVEFLFSFPLLLLAGDAVLHLPTDFAALGLVAFTVISVLPLVVLRLALRSGRNVAEIQRWRLRNKTFQRVFTGFGFLVLAGFLLAFVILGGAA